jgi:hypothetical protein
MNAFPSYTEGKPYSTFSSYISDIVILWAAATDPKVEPVDGFTLESRADQFVDELALVGRAHNWDKKRIKNGKREQYDDLKADDPSCFAGVKKRIHQGLMGYPLPHELSLEDVKQEFRAFVYQHFKEKITNENREEIVGAWQQYIIELDVPSVIKALDIPEEKQQEFIQYIRKTYNPQFDATPSFLAEIKTQLALNPDNDSHLTSLASRNNLESLLISPRREKAVRIQAFFRGHRVRLGMSDTRTETLSDAKSETSSEIITPKNNPW